MTDRLAVVRDGYDAFNRGDIEAALEGLHPQVEWHTYIVPGPGGGVYRGHDGVRELWTDARRTFGEFRNVPEQILAAGEQVLAYVSVEGVGARSGAAVQARIAHVFTFRDEKILSVRSFGDRDEARRAAGLDEALTMGDSADIVRRAHAAYSAGFDSQDPADVLSLVDPRAVWHTGTGVMDGTYVAHEGVGRWIAEFWESWTELDLETEEAYEERPGVVVATVRLTGRGRSSGAPVDMRVHEVIEVRDGLIVQRREFRDREAALRAARAG